MPETSAGISPSHSLGVDKVDVDARHLAYTIWPEAGCWLVPIFRTVPENKVGGFCNQTINDGSLILNVNFYNLNVTVK